MPESQRGCHCNVATPGLTVNLRMFGDIAVGSLGLCVRAHMEQIILAALLLLLLLMLFQLVQKHY